MKDSDYAWRNVDHTSRPQDFVDYLTHVSASDMAKAYKKQSFDLIGAQKGHSILEIGCGAGLEAIALAEIVGETGKVIAIDNSEVMINTAIENNQPHPFKADFKLGDCESLEFEDNSFDSCRADRVFQHLSDRKKALQEIKRVVRPGGKIVVIDPDYDTVIVDASDKNQTRSILDYMSDYSRNGWSGRQMYRMFKEMGFTNVVVKPICFITHDFETANQIQRFTDGVYGMISNGKLDAKDGENWLAELKTADEQGCFFSSVTAYMVYGEISI